VTSTSTVSPGVVTVSTRSTMLGMARDAVREHLEFVGEALRSQIG
jgi:hypothetical protein